ncbi:SDR family NAD(P)-dependent oxidoreductase [Cytophagaceae bacterium ABcell3]|nr:SDR family NAD(P)-dependent oxidoreductase [Cytophagaceae bacterium ABcell3]
MKIFITGATGYIGEILAQKLANEGHTVHALIRSQKKAQKLHHPNICLFKGDLFTKDVIKLAMEGCDAVFHLAACASVCPEPGSYQKINIVGTKNIIEAAIDAQVKKFVFTSTAGVMGPSPSASEPVSEDSKRIAPYFNEYESTKAEAETLVNSYKDKIHVVTVNPPRVYGPGELSESNAVTKLINLYRNGKWRILPGDGKKVGNYVYVGDVVMGHILALKKGKNGERYLLGGENASYKQLFDTIREVTGVNKKLFKVPVSVMMGISGLMVVWAKITKTKPLITPKWVKKYLYHWSVSSNKAERHLGYTITSLKEGVRKTVEGLDDNKKKPYTLITGASSGIGKAMANELAERNQNLLLSALPDTGLPEVAGQLRKKYGVKVDYFEADLTDTNAPKCLYEWCLKNNYSIDTLVNNAGFGNNCSFEQSTVDDIQNMMQLNVHSLVTLTRLFIPELKKNDKAYILNVGSTASLMPVPFKCVYSASKSFVYSFSKSLRTELEPYNISVSCLCPGPTNSNAAMVKKNEELGWKAKLFVMSPEAVAQRAIKRMYKGKGTIIPGWKNRVAIFTALAVPSFVLTLALKSTFKKKAAAQSKSNEIHVSYPSITGKAVSKAS